MKLHHVGCIVADIPTTVQHYQNLLGKTVEVSTIYHIKEQEVKVCFICIADKIYLELVEPINKESSLAKMNRKKGINFYHLAFKVMTINKMVEELITQGYHKVTAFHSEAFGGKKCVFLYNPDWQLIELIEA